MFRIGGDDSDTCDTIGSIRGRFDGFTPVTVRCNGMGQGPSFED
jgi:hypothetical protein